MLITGCSSGIGHETARHLAGKGWSVYATARRTEAIEDLAAAGCKTLACDVTSEESMRAAVSAVEEAEGAVGALVNNAGYSQSGAIESVPMEQIRRQFETNVFGLIRMSQLALPGMRHQRWGRIVNVSSMGGRLTFPGGGIYHATKFSVEAISDVLRYEVKGFGIGVVCVEPGLIKTKFGEAAVGSMEGPVQGEGEYAEFNAAVASATAGAYSSGPMSLFAAGPDAVAKVIEKAISRKRPKARYPVTFGARALLIQRRLMPDRAWDAFLRSQFPQPK